MIKNKASLTLLLTLIVVLGFGTTKGGASTTSTTSIDSTLRQVTQGASGTAQKVFDGLGYANEIANSDGRLVTKNKQTTISMSNHTAGPIKVSTQNFTLEISLPESMNNGQIEKLTSGPIAFENDQGLALVPIVKADGSLQVVALYSKPSSIDRLTFALKLPEDFSLTLNSKSGIVEILSPDKVLVGGIAAAWAQDAYGKSIPTHYELTGENLTQVIDFSSGQYSYPVTADPWLGFDLIDHTAWANTNPYSPTLSVFPTDWGRTVAAATTYPFGVPVLTVADSLSVNAAWSETLSKTAHTGHPSANTPTMFDQFACHFFYVSKKIPGKASWNLDSLRPDGSLFEQLLNGCNIP